MHIFIKYTSGEHGAKRCQAFAPLHMIGFSMVLGSFLAKAWLVHNIFAAACACNNFGLTLIYEVATTVLKKGVDLKFAVYSAVIIFVCQLQSGPHFWTTNQRLLQEFETSLVNLLSNITQATNKSTFVFRL